MQSKLNVINHRPVIVTRYITNENFLSPLIPAPHCRCHWGKQHLVRIFSASLAFCEVHILLGTHPRWDIKPSSCLSPHLAWLFKISITTNTKSRFLRIIFHDRRLKIKRGDDLKCMVSRNLQLKNLNNL